MRGVTDVVDALEEHAAWLRASGELDRRRIRRARDEVETLALTALRRRWGGVGQGDRLDELAAAVVAGELDPHAAAEQLVSAQIRA